ncbi:MAG: CPBP family intramembrane metalloprotease, partial [Bacteroidia bacterium]|nr:CPBP family intramembrane metalloprotease [Bacteroidia bacterium]
MESEYPSPQTPPEETAPAPLYNRFLERGRVGKNEWWRYAVGVIISFGGYLLFSVPILFAMSAALLKKGITNEQEMREKMTNPEFLGLNPNVLLVLLLLSFAGAMIGLWIAVKFIHKKPFRSIITFAEKIRWKRVATAALAWFLFSGLWIVFAIIKDPENLRFTFEAGPFITTLIIALILLPAQTWWEEFMMRGYLLQAIGQRTKTAFLPVISTSLIFGLLHAGNPEVATHGFLSTMPMYILPGLLFGIIAVLD